MQGRGPWWICSNLSAPELCLQPALAGTGAAGTCKLHLQPPAGQGTLAWAEPHLPWGTGAPHLGDTRFDEWLRARGSCGGQLGSAEINPSDCLPHTGQDTLCVQ